MPGETDLEAMLSTLTVSRRPGTFVVTTVAEPVKLGNGVHALVSESEGTTVVAEVDVASDNGWAHDFECAWLTLDVHSSLDAVGLTAAVSRTLADQGIACNVIAGSFHDHLLVPLASAEDAIAALTAR